MSKYNIYEITINSDNGWFSSNVYHTEKYTSDEINYFLNEAMVYAIREDEKHLILILDVKYEVELSPSKIKYKHFNWMIDYLIKERGFKQLKPYLSFDNFGLMTPTEIKKAERKLKIKKIRKLNDTIRTSEKN